MPNYIRNCVPGGTYFFTVVTEGRRPLLQGLGLGLLRQTFRQCLDRFPFTIEATVVLPDHLHAIWTLPEGDDEYSKRWGVLKKEFTKKWRAVGGAEQSISKARRKEGRGGVWVPRFWEHTIRDGHDYRRHMDYIHYNAVKHGHAVCPHEWKASSFDRSVRLGLYEPDWGCACRRGSSIPPPVMNFDDVEDTVGEDYKKRPPYKT